MIGGEAAEHHTGNADPVRDTALPHFATPVTVVRDDAEALVVWVQTLDDKDALIASAPDVCFTTAHYDGHASVLVRLATVGLDELVELLTDAWRTRASPRGFRSRRAARAA